MGGELVTVLTAGMVVDPYSLEASESWENPTEDDVTGVLVEPRPSSEPVQDARNAVTSGFTLYMPPGTVLSSRNRIVVRGDEYKVIGEPADWRVQSWRAGLVVQVERVDG